MRDNNRVGMVGLQDVNLEAPATNLTLAQSTLHPSPAPRNEWPPRLGYSPTGTVGEGN